MSIPLQSGRSWEDDPAGNMQSAPGRTTSSWLRDADDHRLRALFKRPPPGGPAEIYSIGMERVACVLGQGLGLPVPNTYLEPFGAQAGSLQLRVPERTWLNAGATPMLMTDVVNRADWPLCVAFDVWVANTDRRPPNLGLQILPEGTRAAIATKSKLWLIDHGLCGLWFPSKMDAPDVSSVSVGDGTMKPGVETYARRLMPPEYRQSFTNLTEDERRIVLDRVVAVTDDEIRRAVGEVPRGYFSQTEADKTIALLLARRDNLDKLLSGHW